MGRVCEGVHGIGVEEGMDLFLELVFNACEANEGKTAFEILHRCAHTRVPLRHCALRRLIPLCESLHWHQQGSLGLR